MPRRCAAIARGYRERGIPCDVLYLDIDHMDGYRVFTFDAERFPDMPAFIAELEADGFKVVCITDPGVKVDEDYGVYAAGRDRDLYCKTSAAGVPQRRLARPVRVPGLHEPRGARVVGRAAGAARRRGRGRRLVRHGRARAVRPDAVDDARRRRPPGGGEPRYHQDVHNLYGSLMARAARRA